MRALLAITARELRERWGLPVAAFGWGVVLLFLVRYVDVQARPLAVLAAVPASWTIAALMGSSVIARDLADGRLAFFFARPVPWWAIAGGKLLAALLLSVTAPIASVLPAVLADWNPAADAQGLAGFATGGGLALLLALLLVLVGFGHVASVVYRARSTWAAFDLLLFGGCIWGGVWLFYAFTRLGVVTSAPLPSAWSLLPTLLLVAAVPLTATAVQVAVGRSDLRRGHVALSVTFWSGVFVWLALLGGLLTRELSVPPASLVERSIGAVSPDGRFLILAGHPAGRNTWAAFLYDTATGRSLRAAGSRPAFSADGRFMAWIDAPPFWRGNELTQVQVAQLGRPQLVVETVDLAAWLPAERSFSLALSAPGDRLAIVQGTTLSVHEIPSGRTLSRNASADGEWIAAAFLPGGQLRALRRVRPALGAPGKGILPGRIEVVSLRGGVPESVIRLDAVGHAMPMSPLDRDVLLLNEAQTPRLVSLHDARSGQRIRAFTADGDYQVKDALLLDDGRVAVLEGDASSSRLRLARAGEPDRLLLLPDGRSVVGGELPNGLLALGHFAAAADAPRGETLFVSLGSGELQHREPGMLPALRHGGLLPWAARVPGPATELFVSETGELLRFDPDTGQRKLLLAAPPASR